MAYLHGVEVIELTAGPRAVRTASSSVIGLIGISDTADAQELILVSSDADLAQFGDPVPGNTIAQALKAIFAQEGGGTRVIVVNIYDAAEHLTAVADETVVAVGDIYKGANPFFADVVVENAGGTVTYDIDDDYIIEDYVVKRVEGGAIVAASNLLISYSYLNPAEVTSAELIGVAGPPRTGLQLFDEAKNQFGFSPKIMIAPYLSEGKAFADGLITKAAALKAVVLVDAAAGITPAAAIAERGNAAKAFATSSSRAILLYPRVKAELEWAGEKTVPYSSFYAGVLASSDNNSARGYWFPPTNINVQGITGVERVITFDPSIENTDANLLNAAGITTIVSGYGTGYLAWGQRNASYPTSTTGDNFINVQRVKDIMSLALIQAALPFIGQPITNPLIDTIRETANSFLRSLIQRGAVVDGSKCIFRTEDNPPAQLADGHLVFQINYYPSPGAERITFNAYLDTNILASLTGTA